MHRLDSLPHLSLRRSFSAFTLSASNPIDLRLQLDHLGFELCHPADGGAPLGQLLGGLL